MMIRANIFFGLTAAVVCLTLSGSWPRNSAITSTILKPPRVGPSFSLAANVINPKFVVISAQARKAFDDYELKGEKDLKVSIGEQQTSSVTVQGPLNVQSLTLSINFLSPLDQARKFGYEFGLVAKNRTPADRKDFEDRIVKRIVDQSSQAVFVVKLIPVPDADLNVPSISFTLLDFDGKPIDPTTHPDGYSASPKDIIGQVALEEDGQELIFPVTDGSVPRIIDKMQKMTLTVDVGGQPRKFDYSLKP